MARITKKMNVVEKLREVSGREKKRREQAENYLEELTRVLAPVLEEVVGDNVYYNGISNDNNHTITVRKWNKEKSKYTDNDLYFRFNEYYNGKDTCEVEGFYVDVNDYMEIWGTNVRELKGVEFWHRVKQITDWISNYLPEYIDNLEKSRDQRYEQLEKIMEAISKAQ